MKEKLMDKNFYKNVPPTAIPPVKTEPKPEIVNASLVTVGYNNWQKKNIQYINDYSTGVVSGSMVKKNLTITDFFNKLYIGLKESMVWSLKKQNKNVDEIKEELEILNGVIKILSKYLDHNNCKLEETIAYLQGYMNSLIESINYEKK